MLSFVLFQLLYCQSTSHFFLRCQNFSSVRECLMKELIKIKSCFLRLNEKSFMKLPIGTYNNKTNASILIIILPSIKFIYPSKHFDGQLM